MEDESIYPEIAGAVLARAVLIERLKRGLIREVNSMVDDGVMEIGFALQRAKIGEAKLLPTRMQRANDFRLALVVEARKLQDNVLYHLTRELTVFGGEEVQFAARMLNKPIGVDVVQSSVQLRTPLMANASIGGLSLSDRLKDVVIDGLRNEVFAIVRQGALIGDSTAEMLKRVNGKAAVKVADKVKRALQTIVKTAVQEVSNLAREAVLDDNLKLFDGLQWQAVLDRRTSLICIGLNGKVWDMPGYKPRGHKKAFPGRTAHPNCRSVQLPVFKSWKKLNKGRNAPNGRNFEAYLRAGMAAKGAIKEAIDAQIADLRKRLDGKPAGVIDFKKWFDKQPKKVRKELFGSGRLKLYEQGKIQFWQLTDEDNRVLTLAELRKQG